MNSSWMQGQGHSRGALDRVVLMDTWLGGQCSFKPYEGHPIIACLSEWVRQTLLESGPQNLIPLEWPKDPTQNCCCRGQHTPWGRRADPGLPLG